MSGVDGQQVEPLHTTTVRFDADLWRRLGVLAERLQVPKAELIRSGVREHVVRVETGEQRPAVVAALRLERRLRRVELVLARATSESRRAAELAGF